MLQPTFDEVIRAASPRFRSYSRTPCSWAGQPFQSVPGIAFSLEDGQVLIDLRDRFNDVLAVLEHAEAAEPTGRHRIPM